MHGYRTDETGWSMNRKKIPFLALPRFEREVRQGSILWTGLIRFREMEGLLGMNSDGKITTYHTTAKTTTLPSCNK